MKAIVAKFNELNFNKVNKALKSVGISLKDAQGQFRNLDEIFLELNSKWDRILFLLNAGERLK